MSVVIETTIGDFAVDLFLEERPRACQNFLKLCKIKYYNFSLFHTVQRDFIAQTGDPTSTGKGGSSVYGIVYGDQARYFEAEKIPKIKHRTLGTVSFASHGDNLLGSQFFVTLADALESLDGEHCVFGQVVEGLDVLAKLNDAICDQNFQPYQDIRITHTVVLDDPLDDPRGLEVPERSPSPSDKILKSGRIAADEEIDDTAGRTVEELDEAIEEREAAARATILEMVGDLPDAHAAPPENVLFVCKLNPITTDDDLKIIFSRFGKIISCEIIRDQRTKNSLQYGFIEFDNPKSCENAYFKMDNVLIDDRRIHVDFSQSVSRIQWKGKGRVTYQNGADAKEFGNYSGRGGRGGDAGRGRGRDERGDRNKRTVDERGSGRDNRQHAGNRRDDHQPRDDRHRSKEDIRTDHRSHRSSRHDDRGGRNSTDIRGSSTSRSSRNDRSHHDVSSRNVDRELAARLDVNQLKALLDKDETKRNSSANSEDTKRTKSKKRSKRSKRDSSSGSDSSDIGSSPVKKKRRSRKSRSSSPEDKLSKRDKVGKKPPMENSAERERHKGKDRVETKQGKRNKKKKKKQRRQSSFDDSSSPSSRSEARKKKSKKSRK